MSLNRIVVPSHLRILPAGDPPEIANSPREPDVALEDMPSSTPAPGIADSGGDDGADAPLRRLIFAAAALAGVIVALLVALSSGTEAPAPIVSEAQEGDASTAGVVSAQVGETSVAATEPNPSAEAAAPVTWSPDTSPAPAPRPIAPAPTILADVPPIRVEPVAKPVTPEPGDAPHLEVTEVAPVSSRGGTILLDQVMIGTLEALRGTSQAAPTAAERAIYGFVRSLNPETRSTAEIAAMLDRARDAGTLAIPDRYLLNNGGVDARAILAEMARR